MGQRETYEAHDFHAEDLRTFRTFRTRVEVRVYEDAVLVDAVLGSINNRMNPVGSRLRKLTARLGSGKGGRDAEEKETHLRLRYLSPSISFRIQSPHFPEIPAEIVLVGRLLPRPGRKIGWVMGTKTDRANRIA